VSSIQLERAQAKRVLHLPADKDFALQPGDIVTVLEESRPKAFVEVRGSVLHPGRYEIEEGTHLSEVIKMAGGFMNGAKTDKVKIFSPANAKPREVNFEDIVLGYRGDLEMQPGQTVEVDGPKSPNSGINLSKRDKNAAGAIACRLLR